MKKPLRVVLAAALLTASAIFFYSCEQEAPNPQWDIEILGPVLHAEIGINQLLADSLTIADGDGKLRVVFESLYDNLQTDSVYAIPDTVFSTVVRDTIASFPVNPGSVIPVGVFIRNPYLVIGSSGTPLRLAEIESGMIRVTFRNIYNTNLFFTYSFPKVTVNGNPIILTDTVPPGTVNNPSFSTTDIDISGARIDLTGQTGNLFNSIYYTITVQTDPQGPAITIQLNDTILKLNTELIGIDPYYVSGYFGQKDFVLNNDIILGDGRLFQSGSLNLDSAKLSLEIENGIGADLNAYVSSINSINTATNNNIPLFASGILRQNINLGRAFETGIATDPVRPSRASFLTDNSNSNLVAFLENLPDRIGTDLRISLNPLGNISGNHDFVYKDRLIRSKVRLEVPLRLAADALTLVDTQDFAETNLNDLEPLGPSTFTLIAENGFPIDIRLNLEILDYAGNITDRLLVPDTIPAGITDTHLKVIQPVTTRIRIPVDETRKQHLLEASKILIRASFTTVNSPTLIDLYDNYRLKLKLVADATYSIR
ncbi:MAG: hypothetical protein RL021_1027 [Bacteroidota bacterium]|jgi:hypothetical protein